MNKAPIWFLPAAVLALLGTLAGCAMYLYEVTLPVAEAARAVAVGQAQHAMHPAWALGATVVATGFGVAGCVGLILHRTWAMPLLVLSLLGAIAQDAYLFGMAGSLADPAMFYALQALMLLVVSGLIWLARTGNRDNWLYARG